VRVRETREELEHGSRAGICPIKNADPGPSYSVLSDLRDLQTPPRPESDVEGITGERGGARGEYGNPPFYSIILRICTCRRLGTKLERSHPIFSSRAKE
jgi:hypothetical protein